ncbi:winged helix-turn-helix domain-containing protein [Streptosporangium roseum]|uniref:winged helix-turn-helix domain-containing protein n=1 Tax=Streptosporangium roseum TaxID=2001 RepID=UPI003D9EB9E6
MSTETLAHPDCTEVARPDALVRVDATRHRAWLRGEPLRLPPKQFRLLALLIRNAGRALSREEIMREAWDSTWCGETKTVDMHISWLRRNLGDSATKPRYITTVRGGYRFEPLMVEPQADPADELLARIERRTVEHIASHRDEIRRSAVDAVVRGLEARAAALREDQPGHSDPLADALWERIPRAEDHGMVYADPRLIAAVALEALAAELAGQSRMVPDGSGQSRTAPERSGRDAGHGC